MKVIQVFLIIALSFSGVSVGQENDVIKLRTTLVQIPVIVSDKEGGRYIIDLSAKDFELYENGVEQNIEFFQTIEQPFSVALVLDCSGSAKDQLHRIKEAASLFVETLRPFDKAMILSFSDSVEVYCDLTGNQAQLKYSIQQIQAGEYTQVYEAVYTSVWERLGPVEGRKAVILLSDGIDTASSEISQEDTLDAVVESEDIVVYPIRYNTRLDVERRLERIGSQDQEGEWRRKLDRTYRAADVYLYQLADLSGGVVERADEIADLPGALLRISEELRHQYLIGYYPQKTVIGKHRNLRVKVKRDSARVRVRPGYSL